MQPADDPGVRRDPTTVMLLFIFTLGIYPLVWLWKTSKELDTAGLAPGLHKKGRSAVTFGATAMVMFALLIVLAILASTTGGVTPFWAKAAARVYQVFGIGALVFTIWAWWRIWTTIANAERDARVPAISPGAMIGLFFVPFFNLYWAFRVPYRTQAGLNWLWEQRRAPLNPVNVGAPASVMG